MTDYLPNEAKIAQKQIDAFYNSIRATGALRMTQQLNQSLGQQATIMKKLNKQMVKPYQKIAKAAAAYPVVPKSVLSSFVKTNSSLSGIPVKQLSQMIPNQLQSTNGFLKQIAEQQTAFAKKMQSWANYVAEAQQELDHKYSELIPVVDNLSNNGWVVTDFLEIDKLVELKDKSDNEINKIMTDYYVKDNYKQFFYEFDELIDDFIDEDFDSGYLDQLKIIRRLLKENFNNYKVLISTAVSILDFKYTEVIGSVSTDSTLNRREIKSYFQRHKDDERPAIDYLTFSSLLKTLDIFLERGHFHVGVEHTHLTRHAIQHGRYDPSRYKDTDFIKVLLLIIATRFCTDIYHLD